MSNNIFESSKGTEYTTSTLDMSTAVRDGRYTIPSNSLFSATSSAMGTLKNNYSATSAFSEGTMQGGSIEETRSIPIDQSELRQIFAMSASAPAVKKSTGSISGLVDKINSITESQAGGGSCPAGDDVDSEGNIDSDMDSDDAALLLAGGAAPHLEAMQKLNKHIVNKAGIKFGKVVMKVAKHYREEAKKANPSGNVIELSNAAITLVTKDSDSGKLADVVKRMGGTSQARAKGRKGSKKNSKNDNIKSNKKGSKKGKSVGKKRGGASPHMSDVDDLESSLSSELSFISTSTD